MFSHVPDITNQAGLLSKSKMDKHNSCVCEYIHTMFQYTHTANYYVLKPRVDSYIQFLPIPINLTAHWLWVRFGPDQAESKPAM